LYKAEKDVKVTDTNLLYRFPQACEQTHHLYADSRLILACVKKKLLLYAGYSTQEINKC
jgi:hypothetical protein